MPARRAFAAVLLAFAGLLFWRCADPWAWSGWAFGDAQTLQTLRHWKEDGLAFHHGLFIPSGYSKTVRYLDEPALRQHGHGISPVSSPGVGPRLRYTHYPPGYLYPWYALYSAGLEDPRWLRAAAVLVSLAALWIWFEAFCLLASPPVAALACLFYLGSSAFLQIAHALANQPLDDLFRALGVLLALLEWRATDPQAAARFRRMAWAAALLLSLCSLDSVFFVLAWRVGFDLLAGRRPRWRLWAAFLGAPVLAHALQFLQNAWYLGGAEALHDVEVTLHHKSALGGILPFGPLRDLCLGMMPFLDQHGPWRAGAAVLLTLGALCLVLKGRPALAKPLGLLLLCGSLFGLLLPRSATMAYEVRQLAPCFCLLVGAATALAVSALARWTALGNGARIGACALAIFAGGAWQASAAKAEHEFTFSSRFLSTNPDIAFAKALGEKFQGDRVYFNCNVFAPFFTLDYLPGYHQVFPLLELLADGPVLSFDAPDSLAADLGVLWRRSEFPFSPVLLVDVPEHLPGLWATLRLSLPGLLPETPPRLSAFQTRDGPGFRRYYLLDLTPYLQR